MILFADNSDDGHGSPTQQLILS